MRTGNHLAIVCLFCGAAFAAFVSGSCDMIMARCFRYVVRLVNDLLGWAGTHVSNWLTGAPAPSEASGIETRHPFSAEQQNSHLSRSIR